MRQRIAVYQQHRRAIATDDGADFYLWVTGLNIVLLKTIEHFCLLITLRMA